MSTRPAPSSLGDELTNLALAGLAMLGVLAVLLRIAGSIAAFLTGIAQPRGSIAAGAAVLLSTGDQVTVVPDEPVPPAADTHQPGGPELEEADLYDELMAGPMPPEPPHPINWNLLTAGEAEAEWLALNQWVDWLRRTYGLPASVVPPFWHRHPELVWELSALHLHWIACYDPDQSGSGPIAWHTDFAMCRERLRDWVAACGTRVDRDRPTRQESWPGEDPQPPIEDTAIQDRTADFVAFVAADMQARQDTEDEFMRAKLATDRIRGASS